MHETLTVLLLILTPVGVIPGGHKDQHTGYPVYGWREAGYHATAAACEKAANKMYAQQQIMGDKVKAAFARHGQSG